jgi:hypothetical protein
MGRSHRQRSRDRHGIDPHKHETPHEREQRWKAQVRAAQFDDVDFDVRAWELMHREAEAATLGLGAKVKVQ